MLTMMSQISKLECSLLSFNSLMHNAEVIYGSKFNSLRKSIIENSALILEENSTTFRLYRVNTKHNSRTHEFIFFKDEFCFENKSSKQVHIKASQELLQILLENIVNMSSVLVFGSILHHVNDYQVDTTKPVTYEYLTNLLQSIFENC